MTAHPAFPRLALLALLALAACDKSPTSAPIVAGPREADAPLLSLSADAVAVPDRYVVVMNDGSAGMGSQIGANASVSAQRDVAALGGKVHHRYSSALNGFAATLSPAALRAVRRNPNVAYVIPDARIKAQDITQSSATWGLDRIDQRNLPLSTTYTYGLTGAGVRVYIIDTGIRTSHTQFGGRATVGADFIGDGQNGQDCSGHGTHVAGTVGGSTYGVAKSASLISVRVLDCNGDGLMSNAVAGVDWVTANRIRPAVANMSLGGGVYEPLTTAVTNSIASGVVYAVAAGNENVNACLRSPASTPGALTVGATTIDDIRASYSNFGSCVDLFAPGSSIVSAGISSTTAIATMSGTSMASPHVAGVAALYLQLKPTAPALAVADSIRSIASTGRLSAIGAGSPNRLLFSRVLTNVPSLTFTPDSIAFTFIRGVTPSASSAGMDTTVRQQFAAGGEGAPKVRASVTAMSHSVVTGNAAYTPIQMKNVGTNPVEWVAGSTQPWLFTPPVEGLLNPGHLTAFQATVYAGALAAGSYSGQVVIDGNGLVNAAAVRVNVNVLDVGVLVPGTPLGSRAGALNGQAAYMFTVPAGLPFVSVQISGGTGDADLYVKYGAPPSFNEWDCRPYRTGNSETCTLNMPLPGVYFVMLHGYSEYSGVTLSVTNGGPPFAPSAMTNDTVNTTFIGLHWSDNSSNETSFQVQRRVRNLNLTYGPWATIASPAANATTVMSSGLVASTLYQHRVRACNASGCSAWSLSPVVSTLGLPAGPTTITSTVVTPTRIDVTWTDASVNETKFEIWRRIKNPDGTFTGFVKIASPAADATSYSNTGLVTGTTYQYRIRACNAMGCSGYRQGVLVTP